MGSVYWTHPTPEMFTTFAIFSTGNIYHTRASCFPLDRGNIYLYDAARGRMTGVRAFAETRSRTIDRLGQTPNGSASQPIW